MPRWLTSVNTVITYQCECTDVMITYQCGWGDHLPVLMRWRREYLPVWMCWCRDHLPVWMHWCQYHLPVWTRWCHNNWPLWIRWSLTSVNALMLLDVWELLEGFIAEFALIFADVGVHERVLRELLRGRKRLETVAALVTLLLQTVHFLGVTVQLGFRVILLPRNTQQNTTYTYTHNRDVALNKIEVFTYMYR